MTRFNLSSAVAATLFAACIHSALAEDLQFIKKEPAAPTKKKTIAESLADLPYKTLADFQGFLDVTRNTINQITTIKVVNRRFRHFHYSAEVSDQYYIVVSELTDDQKALIDKYTARNVTVSGKYREYKEDKWLTLAKIELSSAPVNIDAGGQWSGDAKVLFSTDTDSKKESLVGKLKITKQGVNITAAKITMQAATNQTAEASECSIITDGMESSLKQSMGKLDGQVVSVFGITKEANGKMSIKPERVIKYTPKK